MSDDIIFNGRTGEEIIEMCCLLESGGIRREVMLARILELKREVKRQQEYILNLELDIELMKG